MERKKDNLAPFSKLESSVTNFLNRHGEFLVSGRFHIPLLEDSAGTSSASVSSLLSSPKVVFPDVSHAKSCQASHSVHRIITLSMRLSMKKCAQGKQKYFNRADTFVVQNGLSTLKSD